MKTFAPFFQVLGISITLCTQAVFADEDISAQEADSLIKDDIAATQVLQEICPAFVGTNKKLESNTQKIIAMYLQGYSNKSITLSTLQNDAEFKTLLNEARQAAKQMDHHEQHELCEEIINYKE
ncbi:MCR_0457 family protein [Acinetobacter sp. 161(2023)]|uniref:MCR_0457 family protein n=1 Tax=Acinetobacter sp. 161(2023) TaxID=3098768 RepID=UPI003008276D